jgi:hypothetical protein
MPFQLKSPLCCVYVASVVLPAVVAASVLYLLAVTAVGTAAEMHAGGQHVTAKTAMNTLLEPAVDLQVVDQQAPAAAAAAAAAEVDRRSSPGWA